eukprot:CAMPEP_0117734876 /NCGR_PEP_ID=MMETSP0947-20121206/947_1 /TAXON_ID=44440 /ORGANISM="Chattonella subsalsa, Strain CCMP2191" /LENGTH=342 /DNA_ID=CAMNT_0005549763 /DNA_START=26 /DNA_END=1054 /DNA_ORIENTATION=-
MKIFNAVLAGQRVMFVAYNLAAESICQLVLAACGMVSPPLTGLSRRAFPYAMLSDLSFLEVPGYIAGSTNPMFAQRTEWWDLLCTIDISQGTASCTTAEEMKEQNERKSRDERRREGSPNRQRSPDKGDSADQAFIEKVISGVEASLKKGWVAKMFQQFTQDLLDQELDWRSSGSSHQSSHAFSDVPTQNDWRVASLRDKMGVKVLENPWETVSSIQVEDGIKLRECVRLLVAAKNLHQAQVIYIFETLEKLVKSEEEAQVLLSLLPEEKGGLYPIALGLLNSSPVIKQNAYRILRLIEKFPSTCPAVGTLNFFLRVSFTQFHCVFEEEPAVAGSSHTIAEA